MSMRENRSTLGFAAAVLAIVSSLASVVPAHAAGPFQYFAVTPCRVVDSRTTNATEGTTSTPLSNGLHSFRIQGQCGIPNGALATTMNLTVVGPNQVGHLVVFPSNASEPIVSTLNYVAGEPALANGAITPLGPVSQPTDKDLTVRLSMAAPGHSDFIVDVTGYFQ